VIQSHGELLRYRRSGRAGRLIGALRFGLSGREAPLVALAGFLVRGGIVVLTLPAVVLPSVIGLAEITGVRAITIDGTPTSWLLEAGAVAAVCTVAWLAIAGLVGALVDVWLVEMALAADDPDRRRLPLPETSLVLRLVAIRAVCAIPLAGALVWAGGNIFDVTYAQLITPSDLAQPLALRVIAAAAGVVAVVVAVWLAGEAVAAIAVRREILAGGGIWRSIWGAVIQIATRPFSTALTIAASYGASAVAISLALVATATAFSWCQIAARNVEPIAVRLGIGSFSTTRDFRPVVFALTGATMALAWVVALLVSGVASAWRSGAFSHEVADALTVPSSTAEGAQNLAGLGLSGGVADRSGD
jgi:hypothetical protein